MIRQWLRSLRHAGTTTAIAEAPPEWFADWWAHRRNTSTFYTSVPTGVLDGLRAACPDRVERTIETAERILRHEFTLLGSSFTPVDPDRASPGAGYRPIDWRLDPRSGLRFPPSDFDHSTWNLMAMRPGLADIKLPWELARCQHWVTLGQAWRLARDVRFADEIADELDDFMTANPIGRGIHWTCTMDVALRAVSWALALDLVGDAGWPPDRVRRAYEALYSHGAFIRANLEDHYEVTSNHYLSNLVGLYFLGALFEDTAPGASWLAFAEHGLAVETEKQVLPDGADFESAIPYHRLVAELLLGCVRLGVVRRRALPSRVADRVRGMVRYLAAVLRPDGLMPVVGDADDGRLHVLTDYGCWDPQDARHLLGAAGACFDDPSWKALSGAAGRWEAGWWGFEIAEWPAPAAVTDVEALFPDAGTAVIRRDRQWLLIANSRVGTNGFGNHKHNDQLSFEYHLDGRPVIVDPGSYVYTANPDARNAFRSVRSHSTVAIDGREQNEFNPDWLFRMFAHEAPLHLLWAPESLTYAGRHRGYTRFNPPVVHDRIVQIVPGHRALLWVDRLDGAGAHRCSWHLQWAPGISPETTASRILVRGASEPLELLVPAGFDITHGDGACSPSYGVRHDCRTTDLLKEITLGQPLTVPFALVPSTVLDLPVALSEIERALAALEARLP